LLYGSGMKTIIKAIFVVGSMTAAVAMADAPKKPDVTKPADKTGSGSAAGSATDTKSGSGAGSAVTKPAEKTPAKATPKATK
jgi:hypothetical protein